MASGMNAIDVVDWVLASLFVLTVATIILIGVGFTILFLLSILMVLL